MESGKNVNKVRTTFRQRKVVHFSSTEEADRFIKLYRDIFEIFKPIHVYDGDVSLGVKVEHQNWIECVRCLKLKKFKPNPQYNRYEWKFENASV